MIWALSVLAYGNLALGVTHGVHCCSIETLDKVWDEPPNDTKVHQDFQLYISDSTNNNEDSIQEIFFRRLQLTSRHLRIMATAPSVGWCLHAEIDPDTAHRNSQLPLFRSIPYPVV